jgi:hypothetical protein
VVRRISSLRRNAPSAPRPIRQMSEPMKGNLSCRGFDGRWHAQRCLGNDRFIDINIVDTVQTNFSSINNISACNSRLNSVLFPTLIRSEKIRCRGLIIMVCLRTYSVDPILIYDTGRVKPELQRQPTRHSTGDVLGRTRLPGCGLGGVGASEIT